MTKKICFTASSGGHLEEVSKLAVIQEKYESFLVTEKNDFMVQTFCKNVYFVNQINRKEAFFFAKFFNVCFQSLHILIKEKPDTIISTGALTTYPLCLFGKIMGKKIVYIESFARVDTASLTGKFMYRIADLFIVQWEEMLEIFPKAIYGGGIL